MDVRCNGWWRLTTLFVMAALAVVGPAASAGEADGTPDGTHTRFVYARSPDVRLRERPDEQSPIVDLSLVGARRLVRATQGDWLQVDSFWIRLADVIEQDEAIQYFSAAIAQAESVFFYLGRAGARLAADQNDKAQADVSEALRLDARCSRAYLVRGWIAQHLKQKHETDLNFDRALELDPRDAIALHARGWESLIRREYDTRYRTAELARVFGPWRSLAKPRPA